jgi:hypothetical protein
VILNRELELEMAKSEIVANKKERVAFIPHNNPQPVLDKLSDMFAKKSEEYKDNRRRKKV